MPGFERPGAAVGRACVAAVAQVNGALPVKSDPEQEPLGLNKV